MAHPGRGRISTRRSFRSIPRREEGRLLNRGMDEICFIPDLSWRQLTFTEAQGQVNVQNENRTWLIPMAQLGGLRVYAGYALRIVKDNTLWEIQQVSRSNEMWYCVSVKMNEHDEYVP